MKRELLVVVVAAAVWGMLARPERPEPFSVGLGDVHKSIEQMRPALPPPQPQPQPPERIGGRVVDAVTGQAVTRAMVRGWGKGLKVGKDGRFSAEAHQDVSALVEAPYYDRQKVVLEPGRFREIRLVPATPID